MMLKIIEVIVIVMAQEDRVTTKYCSVVCCILGSDCFARERCVPVEDVCSKLLELLSRKV